MEYIDIDDRHQLPVAPTGFRYLDFIGGTRELRCFLVPEVMPRNRFMRDHIDLLESCHAPVYERDGVIVRQDATYALPGFYIVSLSEHYAALDLIPKLEYESLCSGIRAVRAAMRAVLSINFIHVHYEEKPSRSTNVHVWLMPVPGDQPIMRLNLRDYLSSFRYSQHGDTILAFNQQMRDALS